MVPSISNHISSVSFYVGQFALRTIDSCKFLFLFISFFSSTLTITILRDLQIPFPVVVLAGVPGDAVHLPDRLVGSHGVGG